MRVGMVSHNYIVKANKRKVEAVVRFPCAAREGFVIPRSRVPGVLAGCAR